MAKINLGILIESGHWFWQVDWFPMKIESPMQPQCSHVWDFLMRFIYSPWQRYWTVRSHLHSYPWFSWTQSQWWHQQRELWQKTHFPWPLPPWSQGARYKEDLFQRSLAPPCSSGNGCPCSQLGWPVLSRQGTDSSDLKQCLSLWKAIIFRHAWFGHVFTQTAKDTASQAHPLPNFYSLLQSQ